MSKDPFTLTIRTGAGRDSCTEVVCREVMRAMEKTRMVYDAVWQGRRVVLKVFAKFGKARYHAWREWRGLRQLEARQIGAPRPLFFGPCAQGWAVATEYIENAVTAAELWKTADGDNERVRLLCLVARQLARQHEKGVLQSDLHLGNFMVRSAEVFALDPAMMRFCRGPLGRRRSIRQVAQLAGMLSEEAGAAIETVFREYAEARSWTIFPRDLHLLQTQHRRGRGKAIERGLRKFLRTNRRHQAIRHGPWRGLADRALSNSASLDELTTGLDEAGRRGRILKDGRTAFVSHTTLGGRDVVIKRYNCKGLLHSLRHTLKGSRARRSWRNANRLSLLGIPTPRPLAYLDERRGLLLHRSYFITEFVDAQDLHRILADEGLPGDRKRQLVDQLVHMIDRLASQGISHGDTKHTNILYDGTDVVLTDLDAMRISRTGWFRRRRRQRDLDRCLRDLGALGMTSWHD